MKFELNLERPNPKRQWVFKLINKKISALTSIKYFNLLLLIIIIVGSAYFVGGLGITFNS